MPPERDAYDFSEPWLDLRGHSSNAATGRRHVEQELLSEVGDDHPLVRQPVEAIAHFTRQDEVLSRTANGYVIAHLMTRRNERWIRTKMRRVGTCSTLGEIHVFDSTVRPRSMGWSAGRPLGIRTCTPHRPIGPG
jgi:hypothetical protein